MDRNKIIQCVIDQSVSQASVVPLRKMLVILYRQIDEAERDRRFYRDALVRLCSPVIMAEVAGDDTSKR